MTYRRFSFIAHLLLAGVLVLGSVSAADARAGGSSSSGSRGSKTFSAPPPTATAPTAAQPMQRTTTPLPPPPSAAPAAAPVQAPRPAMAAPPPPRPSFARSLMTGLAGGFLGAGLFGMLSGGGFFSGLGSFTGLLGFLVQIGIVVGLGYLLLRLLRGWRMPSLASAGLGGGAASARDAMARAGGGAAPRPAAPPPPAPVEIGPADLQSFENALKAIQLAYGKEDVATLRRLTTPEMATYFEQDLGQNAAKGVINRLGEPTLLQGDLSEAWREGADEYATVAMRYSLTDAIVDRATGHVVSGSLEQPQEATEIWTFRRKTGGDWVLSAIQQTR